MQSDSSGFHNHVIIDCFGAFYHAVHLLDSAAERFCEFFVVRVETLIAEALK